MSSVSTVTDSSCGDECGMNDLAAEMTLEICSLLEVRDQLAVRRVCKRWRCDLLEMFLSRYVDMDASKIPGLLAIQSKHQTEYKDQGPTQKYYQYLAVTGKCLEHALNRHIQKNTKVLVLRHVAFEGTMFGMVAQIIKDKQADLSQLILQDCKVGEEYAAAVYCWLNPQRINSHIMPALISITRKLILSNYTISDALGAVISPFSGRMPGGARRDPNPSKTLPIVLPRYEFDCSKPFVEHYRTFIMALESHCPQVSPEVRDDVVQLYSSWIHDDAIAEDQWQWLGVILKRLNEGVPGIEEPEVNVAALRQLDPRTLNKLTMKALQRIYFSS